MFKILNKVLKLSNQFNQSLREKIHSAFDFIKNKSSKIFIGFFINSWTNDKKKSNYFIDMAANFLVGKELDKYIRSLKPLMPLLNHDPAIKSMKIEWDISPIDKQADMREGLEEEIINKYVRYVSRHIFVLLQPNKHKILLNATANGQLGSYQMVVGEQVLYKGVQQLENYLTNHLMGALVSYSADGLEGFTYFVSNIDETQYKELSIKIKELFRH